MPKKSAQVISYGFPSGSVKDFTKFARQFEAHSGIELSTRHGELCFDGTDSEAERTLQKLRNTTRVLHGVELAPLRTRQRSYAFIKSKATPKIEIKIERKGRRKYEARATDKDYIVAEGESMAEVIGTLVMDDPKRFGVILNVPEEVKQEWEK